MELDELSRTLGRVEERLVHLQCSYENFQKEVDRKLETIEATINYHKGVVAVIAGVISIIISLVVAWITKIKS